MRRGPMAGYKMETFTLRSHNCSGYTVMISCVCKHHRLLPLRANNSNQTPAGAPHVYC